MSSSVSPTGPGSIRNTLLSSTNVLPQLGHLGLDTIAVLGEGGMGVVYRVRDRRLRRDAALKLIRSAGGGVDPRAINRFRREVLVTAQLDHPGIPPVYDSGTDPQGQPYMLMRVVEGRPLSEIIKEHHEDFGGELSQRELVEVVLRVAEAVAYAHTQGIVHRDLKPANVMVGRFGEVLVMDWGLARELAKTDAEDAALREEVATSQADEAAESGMTLQGAVVGTPGYMPPEQAEGIAVDERADVFALGALLCCVLTGSPPIQGQTSVNRLVATLQGKIRAPRELKADVPHELNAIAVAALAEEADERTPTVLHFMRDLRAYLAGGTVGAYRYSLRERTLRWLRRHVALLLICLLSLLLAIGVGGAAVYAIEFERQARATQEAAEREVSVQADLVATRTAEKERVEQALEGLARANDLANRGNAPAEVKREIEEVLARVRTRFTLNHAARIYEEAGSFGEAEALLREAAETYAPGYRELFALHLLQQRQGHAGAIITDALRLLRVRAKARGDINAFTLSTRAQDAQSENDLLKALRLYSRAIELAPRFVWALNNRASLYLALGRPKHARDDADAALRVDPTFPHAIANRGMAKLALGDFDGALDDLSLTTSLMPKEPRGWFFRAQARVKRLEGRRVSKAEQRLMMRDIEQGLKLEPTNPLGLTLRAAVKMALKDTDGALADLNLAIKTRASYDALVQRGILHRQLGRNAAARLDFERARDIASSPHRRAQMKQILSGLPPR